MSDNKGYSFNKHGQGDYYLQRAFLTKNPIKVLWYLHIAKVCAQVGIFEVLTDIQADIEKTRIRVDRVDRNLDKMRQYAKWGLKWAHVNFDEHEDGSDE